MTGASEQPGIRIDGVSKRFGALRAVQDVTVDIRPGEFFSLLGPSGCGKTTLLRTIAGFEQPDSGRIFIGSQDVTRRRPQDRPTAMVFQNYALFPTMTVEENVAYGLAAQGMARRDRKARIADMLARVGLAGLEARPVTALSGGQQQRVALARAIAVQPSVLLFDEPLSNLDVALREQTRREIKEIQASLGTTSVYVTHDQQEALAMSDRIGVMRAGQLVEVGTPEALYNEPNRAYVAQFFGSNVIRDAGLSQQLMGEAAPKGKVLSVRPEHLMLSSESGVRARVLARQFLGTVAEWWLEVDRQELRAWAPPGLELAGEIGVVASKGRWVEADG